ncbi:MULTISPECIES: glycosyltransferase family 4 protein [unclassified Rathayibacter]|uniref:glycosyltransferase family 4 protein n=1 Tax=unclassified Rathayibacter TaxID=2609250 RepID=UPI0010E61C28|nr:MULTISPECIES: glycosyltransferase family 4 protein [unclassified Rathayibacter]TCL85838.1 glycosyltransferase involved in cell wall biosynthesis [Rathayibacter sp. PhB192]TCM31659.1 glycosyltransferase involved in cell wall biosynthesis [Rathayibacter sp. PhB179]
MTDLPGIAGLRVGMLAPVAWRTPPRHYGPWERVASLLTEGLVRRGVDVTLFATGDSETAGRLSSVVPQGYAESGADGRVQESLHIAHALARSREFDLVHNHLDWLPLALAAQWPVPLVTTVHGFSGPGILPAYREALRHPLTANLVSISESDRSSELDYVATVHHGIDLSELPYSAQPGSDDLVVLGRIHPDKGTAEAVRIAAGAGLRLVIAGIVQDERYWREEVEPHVDGDRVVYAGSVGPAERATLLGSAVALLHPIGFDEPFGLSVVEAMACGTPVIAYRRGSMPGIVDEGVSGFVVDSAAEAVAAVPRARRLDRARVRETAVRRFAVERMVDDYLRVYARVLGR